MTQEQIDHAMQQYMYAKKRGHITDYEFEGFIQALREILKNQK